MPVYIEKLEIGQTFIAGRTDEQGKIELLSQCHGPRTAEMNNSDQH